MGQTLAIRLTDELLAWLKETSARNGVSMEKLVREQIGKAISTGGKRRSLRHAGELRGPADPSSLRTASLTIDETDFRMYLRNQRGRFPLFARFRSR
jgi:plasmid stability protein